MLRTQNRPIVLDVGSQKRKRVKELKRGEGPLVDDIHEALMAAGIDLSPGSTHKEVVPVVILYEKRRKRANRDLLSTMLLGK